MRKNLSHLFVLAALVAGCARSGKIEQSSHGDTESPAGGKKTLRFADLEKQLKGIVACVDARSRIFDAYLGVYAENLTIPEGETVESNLDSASGEASSESDELNSAIGRIHRLLNREVRNFSLATKEEGERDELLHLIRLEMRSELEPEYLAVNHELDQAIQLAQSQAAVKGLPCANGGEEKQVLDARAGDIAYAAQRTMATAYQSCQVLELAPVTKSVEDVKGVERTVQVDSVGWGRSYTNLRSLKKTHYYHRVTKFSGKCLDQDRKPLVYDYGGEPAIDRAKGALDLFVNIGGGPARGIDCSAFVSSAVVSSGSLYTAGSKNRAEYSRFVSRDFINAKKSRWNCYEQVRVNAQATIEPGDIAAYPGHVVIVDSVGADPFGLRLIQNRAECSKLSARNFDFVLIQSSSSKEHLGINRYLAKDYLQKGDHMTEVFMLHAYDACLSKFDGIERVSSTSNRGIIRHLKAANCLAPRIKLSHEACVESCMSL